MITKKMMQPLLKKQKELLAEEAKIDKAICALQELCEHDYKSTGHDHHREHFKCSICSKESAW